jgi:hypothetical protein
MGWVLRLVETGVDGASRSVDVMVIDRLGDLGDIAQGNRISNLSEDFGEECVLPSGPLDLDAQGAL